MPGRPVHEGVPPHIEGPLRRWIYRALERGGVDAVTLRLRITIDCQSTGRDGAGYLASLQANELLDVVQAILHAGGPFPGRDPYTGKLRYGGGRAQLQLDIGYLLDIGGSAYQVNDDVTGLERRVDETTTAQVAAAAPQHLGKAKRLARRSASALGRVGEVAVEPLE